MYSLNRIKVGSFDITNSISIEEIENKRNDLEKLKDKIIQVEEIFKDKPKFILNSRKMQLFLNGVNLKVDKENDRYIYNL